MRQSIHFSIPLLVYGCVLHLLQPAFSQTAGCVGVGCKPLPMPSLICPAGYGIPATPDYPVSNDGQAFHLACSPGSYICAISVDIEQNKYLYGITGTCCSLVGPDQALDRYLSISPMFTAEPSSYDLSFRDSNGLNFLQWSYTGYYMGTSKKMQAWGVLDAGNFLTMCPDGTLITALYGNLGSGGQWLSTVLGTCNSLFSPCPVDYYSTGGVGTCRACSACSPGKYLSGCNGGSRVDGSCMPCPFNTSGGGGLSRSCQQCTKCEQGFYLSGCNGSSVGDGWCSACPSGFYGAGGYSRQCTACPPGSYGCLGATPLYSSCPPGSYCTSPVGVPLECPPGSYGCSGGKTSFLPCPSGSYCPYAAAATPTPCGQGTFQTDANATVCVGCMAGTYQPGTGKSLPADCLRCPAGKYQPGTGALNLSFCITCPIGTYGTVIGANDSSACVACQPGYYQPVAGATSVSACVKCGVGRYQSSSGAGLSGDCTACPVGTFQTGLGMKDVQNCSLCYNGTYQTGRGLSSSSDCLKCSAGKYQSALGQANCTQCQAGTYSSATGMKSQDNCTQCRPGSYQSGMGLTASSACLLCGLGTYQSGLGMTSSVSCTACSAGTYQNRSGASSENGCLACAAGKYQTGSGMRSPSDCIQCWEGTYQNISAQTSPEACLPCQPGGFQTGIGASICVDCQPGTYQPLTGITSSDQCILCSPGTFQPRSGRGESSSCLRCREGTYQTGLGAGNPALCTLCMPGAFQTGLGMADSSSCIACGSGTYQSGVGLSSIDACLACPPGTYQTATGVGNISGCLQCQPGNFQLYPGSTGCLRCEPGKFSLLRGQPLCATCSVGTFAPVAGMSVCRKCDPGQFLQEEGQTVCSRCPVGKFSGGNGSVMCFSCMPGTFLDTVGASACNLCGPGLFSASSSSTSCDRCQTGQYQDRSGGSACPPCRTGKFQNLTMASVCSDCPAGYFQNFLGQTVCQECKRAQYTSSPGMARCLFCNKGQFQPLAVATVCQNCLAGQFQANPLILYCQNCTPGAFQPDPGSGSCILCPPGWFSNVSSATACVSCYPGQFQPLQGGSVCNSCQPGWFSSSSGTGNCTACRPGGYQQIPGSTSCLLCDRGTFLSSAGSTRPDACLPCRPGWYSNLTGASVCLRCSPGLFSNASGSTSCTNCSSGGYQTGSAASTCSLCLAGMFSALAGRTSTSVCVRCRAGQFSSVMGSSSCFMCDFGTYQTGSGSSACRNCSAGSYGDALGSGNSVCSLCVAGTYSTSLAASSVSTCVQCPPGYVSSVVGSKSGTACSQCARGKFSSPAGTACLACPSGTYCPAGSGIPIQCVGRLLCDGQSIDAGPGFLPYLRGGCTGILPCPAGSQCAFVDPALGKGILAAAPNDTHYVVYLRGDTPNQAVLSCNETVLSYGARQASSPMDYVGVADVLYYLKAMDCGVGSYLSAGSCVSCFAGTFSARHPVYSSSACTPCPAGTQAWSTGSTACTACAPGMFSGDLGMSACLLCSPGTFQPGTNSSLCRACAPGSFASVPGLSSCVACPAGMGQPLPGASSCVSCAAGQFSSKGDGSCSQCGQVSTPIPSGQSCALSGIPDNSTDVWLTVGGNETDSCMAQGLSAVQNQAVGVRVIANGTGGVCRHSVQFMTRPALTQTWGVAWTDLRRPSFLRVVPHNATFYRQSCALQGFGVLFTVSDERGFARTNLTGASAVMIIQDTAGSSVYFQSPCSSMPAADAPVPVGSCLTRDFCPDVSVSVAVRLIWPDSFQLQDSAQIALGSGSCSVCQPTADWKLSLDVVQPCAPFLPGDTISLQLRAINGRDGAYFLRMVLRIMPAVQFVSFQTLLPLSATYQNGALVITGRYVQTTETMGVINLRLISSASNITTVAYAGANAEITMNTFDSLSISVRSQGFSCREDGVVAVITDYDRPTSLLVQASKPMLVQWSLLGTPLSMFPASVSVVAVSNVMGQFRNVSAAASCVSKSPFLLVSSCASMQAVGSRDGDAAAALDVSYMGASTRVFLSVFIPTSANVTIFNASDGMSGRYKLVSSLVAGRLALPGVDATPFVKVKSVGVTLQGERWTCSVKGVFSIAGISGICAGTPALVVPKALVPTLYTGGSTSMGLFSFTAPVLQPKMPVGYILLFQGSSVMPFSGLASRDPLRATASSLDQSLLLGRAGYSSACVTISLVAGPAGSAPNVNFSVPCMLPGPVSLSVALSRPALVVQAETSSLLAKNVSLSSAVVLYADGSSGSVLADSGLFLSSDILLVANRTCSSTGTYGLATVSVGLAWAQCISGAASLQVYSRAVVNSTMVCPACTRLTLPDDPLFQQFPSDFPSSIPAGRFLVRQGLADGTVFDVFEPIAVSGACALQSGVVSGLQAGTCTVSSQSVQQGYSLVVVARWAVAGALRCNNMDCQNLNATSPGDGASVQPFGYASSLNLSLSLTLYDQSVRSFSWLAGAFLLVNGTAFSVATKSPQLVYGRMTLDLGWAAAWSIPNSSTFLRVERLSGMKLLGPSSLQQIHCSGIWTEAVFSALGVLSNGDTRPVVPVFNQTPPLVQHSPGRFHADWAGTGTVTAFFRNVLVWTQVQAVLANQTLITSLGMDFVPNFWNTPRNQVIKIAPLLTPSQNVTGWTTNWNLTRRTVTFASSAPSAVSISASVGTMTLLSDYYQAVTISATLVACQTSPATTYNKSSIINTIPVSSGDVDMGSETGLPVQAVQVGSVMRIPVFLFSTAPIQSFLVEISFSNVVLNPLDCSDGAGQLQDCIVYHTQDRAVFRAAGFFSGSQISGRFLACTISGVPLLDTVAWMRVNLIDMVTNGTTLTNPNAGYLVRMGMNPLPSGSSVVNRRLMSEAQELPGHAHRSLLSGVWGDTNGDGLFTSADVLFLESYLGYIASTSPSGWQMLQLCPIRDPNSQLCPVRDPKTQNPIPDGRQLLFLFRALMGKTVFLTKMDVVSTGGFFSLSMNFVDFQQTQNPAMKDIRVEMHTYFNRLISFQTSSWIDGVSQDIMVRPASLNGDLVVQTSPTSMLLPESINFKIVTQTTDPFGLTPSDRLFTFSPDGWIGSITVTSRRAMLRYSLLSAPSIPAACVDMCVDESLFSDFSFGGAVWSGQSSQSVQTGYVLNLPAIGYVPVEAIVSVPGAWSPLPVTENFTVSEQGLYSGQAFNVTFTPLPGSSMGLYRVDGAKPVRAYMAELSGSIVFVQSGPWSQRVDLEFIMPSGPPGPLDISVVPLNVLDKTKPMQLAGLDPVLRASVQRLALVMVSTSMIVLCQHAILWSMVGGTDDACPVTILESWHPTGLSESYSFVCTSYPCAIQHGNRTYSPNITVYMPVSPRIVVQKQFLVLNQKTSWKVVCDMEPGLAKGVKITEVALAQGLVVVQPPNSLLVTGSWIRAVLLGQSGLFFAGVSTTVSVADGSDVPVGLTASLVTGASVSGSSGTATLVLLQNEILAGYSGRFLIHALFAGGYQVRLDPAQHTDGVTVVASTPFVTVSPLDGNCTASKNAPYYSGVLALVSYQGLSANVSGVILPLVPESISVCCGLNVTSPGSAALGLAGYSSTFTFSSVVVSFRDHGVLNLSLVDPRISSAYDTGILSYEQGYWSVRQKFTDSLGPTVITVTYTHPGTLVTVQASVHVNVVGARDLLLFSSPAMDTRGETALRRIHCSTVFQNLSVTGALDVSGVAVDVTSELRLLSSDPAVARVLDQALVPVKPGTVTLTVFGRGFVQTRIVRVLNESIPVSNISSQAYVLTGHAGEVFPLRASGVLQGGLLLDDIVMLKPSVAVDGPVTVQGYSLALVGNTGVSPGTVAMSLPSCMGSSPGATVPLLISIIPPRDTVDVVIAGFREDSLKLSVILAGSGVTGFYLEIFLDQKVVSCIPDTGFAGIFACNTGESDVQVILAGASVSEIPDTVPLAVVTVSRQVTRISGRFEFLQNSRVVSGTITAGQLGMPVAAVSGKGMPLVDIGTLGVQYRAMMSSGKFSALQDLLYNALVLVRKQRYVQPSLYSNDFELSAMFRVTDRFLDQDEGACSVFVKFHTTELPSHLDSTQDAEWLVVPAKYKQDGWYAAEWRQKIPALNVSLSYSLTTPSLDLDWQRTWEWTYTGLFETGLALPDCPRGAYAAGVMQAEFLIDGSGSFTGTDRVVQELSCSLHVASRRISITQRPGGQMVLSVGLESFARLYQTNLLVMNDTYVASLLSPFNFSFARIQKGAVSYVNDSVDGSIACPDGFYFNSSGVYRTLPMHAVAGIDCYDFTCVDDYERDGDLCSPTPVTSNLIWTTILIIVGIVFAVVIVILCVQLFKTKSPGDIVDFDKEEIVVTPETDRALGHELRMQDPGSGDSDAYTFPYAHDHVFLDAYSAMIIEDMFSPTQREVDGE